MPRGRMINKQITRSEKVASLPIEGQLLYTWMIPHADIEGRLHGDVWTIKAIVPLVTEITPENIPQLLTKMKEVGLIDYYGNTAKYIQIHRFSDFQRLHKDRESPSAIPGSQTTHAQLMRNSCATHAQLSYKVKEKEKDKIYSRVTPQVREVLTHLNTLTGKHYRATNKDTCSKINARLSEGHTVADFFKVHETKWAEWKGTEMEKYFRPETLYRPSKFEGYLNQAKNKAKKDDKL